MQALTMSFSGNMLDIAGEVFAWPFKLVFAMLIGIYQLLRVSIQPVALLSVVAFPVLLAVMVPQVFVGIGLIALFAWVTYPKSKVTA